MLKIESKGADNKVNNLEYVGPEIWKDIRGYKGKYKISNKGRVKSYNTRSGNISNESRFLSHRINVRGYHTVVLHDNNEGQEHYVHKLVLNHFKENPENKPQGNHLDGNKDNNKLSNLEWATNKENLQHSWENGFHTPNKGEDHGMAKISKEDIPKIKSLREQGLTYKEIGDQFGVYRTTISRIIRGKNWSHIE